MDLVELSPEAGKLAHDLDEATSRLRMLVINFIFF